MTKRTSQWAVVVEHALGGRLHAGERFLCSVPRLFPAGFRGVDLAVRNRPRLVLALLHFEELLSAEEEARLTFWAHRAQVGVQALARWSKRDHAHFLARFGSSEHRALDVAPVELARCLTLLLQEAQVRGQTPPPASEVPELSLTLDGGRESPFWEPEGQQLIVPSRVLPPLGERMTLLLQVSGGIFPAQGRVEGVGGPGTPSAPVFRLRLLHPEARLVEALEAAPGPSGTPAPLAPRPSAGSVGSPPPARSQKTGGRREPGREVPRETSAEPSIQRASPRFRLHAPVHITRLSPAPVPEVRMDYETGQAFAEEWIDNLSLGGAFVRSQHPLALFSSLKLDIHLPGLVLPPVPAQVVRVLPQGMGVQFELDAATREALEAALEKLAQRPRRALLAATDPALREKVRTALTSRSFEVRDVTDASEALGVLLDDAPWLDLLVIDADMHPATGRSLVRTIRDEGGEQELPIVALAADGAGAHWVASGGGVGLDLVIEAGVAPELLASRVEDALARRRMGPPSTPVVLEAPVPTARRLTLRYETAEALRAAAGVLRVGGAFVLTASTPAQGSSVQLALELPGGATLVTDAEVVSVEAAGVGVAFQLTETARAALEAALTEVGAGHRAGPSLHVAGATASSPGDPGGSAATSAESGLTEGIANGRRSDDAPEATFRPWREEIPIPIWTRTEVAPGTSPGTVQLPTGLELPVEPVAGGEGASPQDRLPPAFQTLLDEEPSNMHGPRVGPFSLLSMLGRGGVAEVHFARALSGPLKGRHVALKRLLPHAARDARFVELFAGEADVTRMLEHPNLVKTLAVGLEGGLPWMAMEVVDGSDLSQLLGEARRAMTPLPVSYAVGVVHALLEALDYVHGASGLSGEPLRLVHCDVSPANVFVTREGGVKLGDFGVARTGGVEMDVAGKAHYLSPDALAGRLEPGVDLWAVAVLLYELLTLQRPFDGPDTDAVLAAVRKRRFVRARKLRPELPVELDRVFERAFSSRSRHHFRSAAELTEALGPWWEPEAERRATLSSITRRLLSQGAAQLRAL